LKHCPNSGCLYREETGKPAEFRDEIERCTDCDTPLVSGPAPDRASRRADSDEEAAAPVTIATFPNDFSAHLTRAHLASVGVDAAVLFDHFPYRSAASWVQLSVRGDEAGKAVEFLETCNLTETPIPPEDQLAHLGRRIVVARWFALSQVTSPVLFVLVLGLAIVHGLIGIPAVPADSETDPLGQYTESLGVEQAKRARIQPGELAVTAIAFLLCAVVTSIFVGAFVLGRRAPIPALRTALYTLYAVVVGMVLLNLDYPGEVIRILLGMIIPTAALVRGIEAARMARRLRASPRY